MYSDSFDSFPYIFVCLFFIYLFISISYLHIYIEYLHIYLFIYLFAVVFLIPRSIVLVMKLNNIAQASVTSLVHSVLSMSCNVHRRASPTTYGEKNENETFHLASVDTRCYI